MQKIVDMKGLYDSLFNVHERNKNNVVSKDVFYGIELKMNYVDESDEFVILDSPFLTHDDIENGSNEVIVLTLNMH